MVTKEEYAILSAAAYQRDPRLQNNIQLPPGWVQVDRKDNNADGYSYAVFKKGNEVVIAFAGTDQDRLTDFWNANIPAGYGTYSPQVDVALLDYHRMLALYPSADITFTGHSLGGGLASLLAVYADRKAEVFDMAPFKLSVSIGDDAKPYL
jgi:putative lipase involved disintegration of autophagic bodies